MKATDNFKTAIELGLKKMAKKDELFAEKIKNPDKNIEDCVTYILNQVKKSGYTGFSDDEVFGMAAHYYDEDKIDIGEPINMKVVVNRVPEMSKEEIEKIKSKARDQILNEERERLLKSKKPKTKSIEQNQLSII